MAELLKKSLKALLSVSVALVLLWLRPSMAAKPDGVPVGVILDLNSELGKMVNNSLALAVEDTERYTATKIRLIIRNVSQNDAVAAAGNASELIEKHKVRAILGPQNSEQAGFIVELGLESQVPVIWFPITGPSLLPPPSPSSNQGLNCFQFQAIAATIEALGWQSIVPIFEDTEYGGHLIPCLSNVLKDMGIRMVNITAIDPDSTDVEIDDILVKLNNRRTHVFLVHMSMDLGIRFIQSAEEQDMMGEGYAWILTQGLSSLTDPQVTTGNPLKGYMQGALGVRPMDSNKTRWRRWTQSYFDYRFNSTLSVYGWWAYHTIEALAMALEKPGADNNGTKLQSEIWDTNFTGLSGINFNLKGGQLDQSVLEVYNVIGPRERVIGYWKPETGLVQNFSKGAKISGKYQLKDPLWPGDTLDKPPKLRIGVVATNSFPELVSVDNSTTPVMIHGFAFNVFLKVVDVLPFPLDYEFVPLPNKSRSGS
ncbi:glutamate receptor 2.3-like [Neltuma alba]|uniref:glutamate receptor 2.3-like n=1 Tax=Neltuma alba TaxID=207710 RepID=UPI0010A39643|nr:glutamate receptor 2.3-like [Prosopis alba]